MLPPERCLGKAVLFKKCCGSKRGREWVAQGRGLGIILLTQRSREGAARRGAVAGGTLAVGPRSRLARAVGKLV